MVGGKGLLLPCPCPPTSASSGLPWSGDAASGLDTCHIYGPDTGDAFWAAYSGCSLFELSGRTLETIYSPKVLGTSGGVPSVTLKSPRGLAILENIFDWLLELDVQRNRRYFIAVILYDTVTMH